MNPLPVLYVHGSASLYGSDKALLDLIANLNRDRFEPIVLVPENGPLIPALQRLDVDVYVRSLSVLHRNLNPLYWLHFFAHLPHSIHGLRRLIKKRGVRLVHTNTSHVYDGALAARLIAVPHVWHVREINVGLSGVGYPLGKLIYACSDRVLVISSAVGQAFWGEWDADPRIQVVHDGVDVMEFNPGRDGAIIRAELGIDPQAPLVGVAGRIAHWKGHELFLQIAARVRDVFPEARFLIVGDAVTSGDRQLKQKLLRLVQELHLNHVVIFTGARSDMPNVMAALDVLVLPSVTPEPFGLVILEAMATARPVIATRQGGPLETVVDGETGYLIPAGGLSDMAEATISLLRAPEVARRMGRSGRDRCERYFTTEQNSQKIMCVYETVLQQRHE
jgi:glycosyltransferase involved in cell wall biosynthesis